MPTPSAPTPFLSAVLSTYDRADLLRRMLESLCAQTLPRESFEVVVVDDGSRDDTAAVVRSFEPRLPVRYSYQRNAGLASARNHGIFLARGDVLLFLDDDDLADERLLEAHCLAHRRFPEPRFAVLGHTRLSPELASDPLMHFVTEVGCYLFSYPHLQAGAVLDFTHFWGGRSSCKRSFLLDHGVFNPVFRFGCEDIELGFRLSRHGFQVVYEPAAVSTTIRPFDLDGFCRRLERQGRSNFVFSRLHQREKVVQEWTMVEAAPARWGRCAPVYDALLHSARELDRLARLRGEARTPPEDGEEDLLHRSYHAAFQASMAKGIVERAAEDGVQLPGAAAPVAEPARPTGPRAPGNGVPVPSEYSSRELESFLRGVPGIHGGGTITWGLAEDTLRFIDAHVQRGSRTLETGSGVSTLLFAHKGAKHTCITPSSDEVERLSAYCREQGVPLDDIRFVVEFSQVALPRLDADPLDLVLIDGGHGFPIPFVDWLFVAPRVRVGGLLIVDDTQLWTGEVLRDFLLAEPEWRVETLFPRGAAFRKVAEGVLKEWNQQPYVLARSEVPPSA